MTDIAAHAVYYVRDSSAKMHNSRRYQDGCTLMIFRPLAFSHQPKNSTRAMMLWVMLACIPGVFAQTVCFGYGSLAQIAIAMVTALAAESAVLILRKRPVLERLRDNSALLTAVLLAVSLPPALPWWMNVLGTAFAIVIVKQLYGGLGHNLFNPAMVGYVVLLVSFPLEMTRWPPPVGLNIVSLNIVSLNIDAFSLATPLDAFKNGLRTQSGAHILQQPIFDRAVAGYGWQWINIGFLTGGLFLLWRNIIRWHIPVSFMLVLGLCATISWLISPLDFAPPLLHLFSGATMLGAFFIATDPVSAATSTTGRLIFGGLIGLLVWLIRVYGGYPDAVAFAVLLANMTAPLLDRYTQHHVYGHK